MAGGQNPPPQDGYVGDAIGDRGDRTLDGRGPDERELDADTPDANELDASAPDANASDVNVRDVNVPDANLSDARAPDANASDAGVGPYPAGPYGAMEGQTLEDLQLQGYVNLEGAALSSTLPFGPTSMQALRAPGRRYALVHTSAFY